MYYGLFYDILDRFVLPAFGDDVGRKAASDAVLPCVLHLPRKVEQIACGSHHTAMLLEDGSVWAVGISSDTKEPIHYPVQLIPAGVVEMPVQQFAAHMDRTTIVGRSGRQVLQVNLWKDPELREYGVFTPSWVDRLLRDDEKIRVREVHRSWVHSVVLTDS
jgi:alpha-tubulin suppressor-like RCC1 family protein